MGMKQKLVTFLGALLAFGVCNPCLAQSRRGDFRQEGDLKVGGPAPDFNLKRLHGDGKVKLSSFKGKKPVVLIFGSYT